MPTLYTQKYSNIRRTWILITGFLVFIIGLGYVFSYRFGSPAILIGAVIFSVLISFLSYWHSDKIALAISKAKEVKHEENPELYHILENLCITAGLPMPKLYIIEESAPNAFATGRNSQHAIIAVTRGLLNKLNRSELEGVLAHELSHIGNYDMLLSTVVVVLVGFIAIASDWFLRWSFFGGFRGRDREEGNLGAIMAIIGIILAIISPLIAMLIQLAISRKREFLADASGALLTRYPEGLASALQKIAADTTPLRVATNATAHLYISNPFPANRRGLAEGGKGKKISTLFMTHPPVEDRIKALKGMKI